ncbi:uncharacterized protein LOC110905804 [Helianthus annuus]|uniref:uncharacterized protein LOC110905804 n=1 Tax=Helianthus annuus TaxID=4232 RepID=UPI001652D037|nr:uncharacterized protein LOC110905804 [Helianthus annuus]
MEFTILIKVADYNDLQDRLELPKILSNQLPKNCEIFKLVDYTGMKYKVAVESLGRRRKTLHGPEWMRKHSSGRDYIHGCLVQAKAETYHHQDLPHGLLWLLSERRLKIDNLFAKVHGPTQSCKVDVCYAFPPGNEKGLAVGFMGSGWTTFCVENDIEEDYQLLLQWMGSTPQEHFNFNVLIFNKDGIGLHAATTHQCNRTKHRHHNSRPNYQKQFEHHAIETHMLTIPKNFVRDHQINSYCNAMLSFGHVKFLVPLRVRTDPRRVDDENHVIMYADWQHILDEAGMTKDKVIRFELVGEKSVAGDKVYFEVC